ncbi:SusC/RagA family TonB-linked outer membrane protein [Pedobacter petrophilus]|uniref:SusC/RagA family TonB-linked outer membrane protein n=1 Tax=Pedobacter petrophilus TaxID=1908241 RepID=A0A7K0G4N0_9SPHI|nr:TonB-dependent receptor [Pedobacter petrophilus]MRX78314.1 SusC/RagA family TonB-linked outer membrane protein [Pedobacter petrophilus]
MKKERMYLVRSVKLPMFFQHVFKPEFWILLITCACLPAYGLTTKRKETPLFKDEKLMMAKKTKGLSFFPFVDITVKGKVVDDKGETMPGVTIKIKGSQLGATTNNNGEFSFSAPEGAILTVSFVGYKTLEIPAAANMTIKLFSEASNLDDVVVLGFGSTQKRSEQTAAYSTLSGKELLKAPVPDMTNALIGKIPGVVTRQGSGVPGENAADIFIRGRSSANSAALIIVDGVERTSFGNIDPNEIESISVLKDASATALYGIKAGNGVIVITTKVGKAGPFRISYSGGVGLVSLTGLPNTVNAFDAASYTTEGENNLIAAGLFTPAQRTFQDSELIKFKDGSDPLRYPDVNWYKAVTKENWLRTQHNLNFSGGSKFATFFISLGYLFEDGMFKNFQPINGYRTSNSFTRYNFRSNLDFNLSKSTVFSIKFGGRVEDTFGIRGGVAGTGDTGGTTAIISRLLAIPAWGVPFFPEYTSRATPELAALDDLYNNIENPRIGVNTFNPYSQLTRNGYFNRINNTIESVFVLNQKLDVITKGLSFKGTLGLDAFIIGVRAQSGSYAKYQVDPVTGELIPFSGFFNDNLGGVNSSRDGYNKTNIQLGFNYDREFSKHRVSILALAQREVRGVQRNIANAPFANQGLVLSTKYNYAGKYFVEFNGAYNGSENFAAGKRYGFFPSVSAAYNVSEEKFLKNIHWLSFLKIRGSWGRTGYSNPAVTGETRFLYNSNFTSGGGGVNANGGISGANNIVYFGNGTSATANSVVFQSQFGNPDITWENSVKRDLGIEASFFKNRLKLTADAYDEDRTQIALRRTNSAPLIYGATLPIVNYGANYNKGYDLELSYNNLGNNFNYGINIQYSRYRNRVVINDEAFNLPAYQSLLGTRLGQFVGYQVIGFYQNAADIAASPVNNATGVRVIPGDLKYQDTNGDGTVDSQDRVTIGGTDIPQGILGVEPTVSYKGISLSALFQGAFEVNSAVLPYDPGRSQVYTPMLGRWKSPADNETASWPVAKPTNYPNNPSYVLNSFLLQNSSYVKLRNVELAYQFPSTLAKSLNVQSIRVSLTGQNLYTWTKFKGGLDPEIANGATAGGLSNSNIYPLSKVYNFSVNVQF